MWCVFSLCVCRVCVACDVWVVGVPCVVCDVCGDCVACASVVAGVVCTVCDVCAGGAVGVVPEFVVWCIALGVR